jgi:hypothetical protein
VSAPSKKLRTLKATLLAACLACSVQAQEGRIIKTLPHFLDREGRLALHPSLFERDAYQAHLKEHPELCSGMRFDVQWKAHSLTNKARLKLEVRGANLPARQVETFEKEIKTPGLFSAWTGLSVAGPDFQRLGSIVAWRITLWDGENQIAEQKSFLW